MENFMAFEKYLVEIANKLKIGQSLKLTERIDEKNTKTPTIKDSGFEEFANPKNWLELVRAIYADNATQFKSSDVAVALKKGTKNTFTVINKKKESFEVIVTHDKTSVKIGEKGKKPTIIEKGEMIKATKESEIDGTFWEDIKKTLDKKKIKNPKEAIDELEKILNDLKKLAKK